jgi:hypothetical protein
VADSWRWVRGCRDNPEKNALVPPLAVDLSEIGGILRMPGKAFAGSIRVRAFSRSERKNTVSSPLRPGDKLAGRPEPLGRVARRIIALDRRNLRKNSDPIGRVASLEGCSPGRRSAIVTRRHPDAYPGSVALIGLAVIAFACWQVLSGWGPDPAEMERATRRPVPGSSREDRLPRWGDDEEVVIQGPGRPDVRVRWGDVREEVEARMIPRSVGRNPRGRPTNRLGGSPDPASP